MNRAKPATIKLFTAMALLAATITLTTPAHSAMPSNNTATCAQTASTQQKQKEQKVTIVRSPQRSFFSNRPKLKKAWAGLRVMYILNNVHNTLKYYRDFNREKIVDGKRFASRWRDLTYSGSTAQKIAFVAKDIANQLLPCIVINGMIGLSMYDDYGAHSEQETHS